MPYKQKARKKEWEYRKKFLFWIRERDRVVTTAVDETLANADKMSRDELCVHIKAKLGRIPGDGFPRGKKATQSHTEAHPSGSIKRQSINLKTYD